jgi:DNA-binding MarR family transcriptional regulator
LTRQPDDLAIIDDMSTGSEITEQEWALWRGFVTMHRHLARELDRQLQRDAGISQADFIVLGRLSEAPDRRLRTGELAELLAWEKSRVSHQVARMEARGLVERTECDTDGRGTWVGVTAEGRRTLIASTRDHAAMIGDLFFEGLSADEKAVLGSISRRVMERINPPACEIDGSADAARDAASTAA